MKTILLLGLVLGMTIPALAWEISGVPIQANLSHGEWELTINGFKISISFDRFGSPESGSGRLNRIGILSEKGGKKKRLIRMEAGITEDISIPAKWTFILTDSSGKEYALLILRYSSDGEDPTLKPIFIVTDGEATEVKKYEFDEKYSNLGEADILTLLSKISKRPMDRKMRDAVDRIAVKLK